MAVNDGMDIGLSNTLTPKFNSSAAIGPLMSSDMAFSPLAPTVNADSIMVAQTSYSPANRTIPLGINANQFLDGRVTPPVHPGPDQKIPDLAKKLAPFQIR
jgi:hypothetical protein